MNARTSEYTQYVHASIHAYAYIQLLNKVKMKEWQAQEEGIVGCESDNTL